MLRVNLLDFLQMPYGCQYGLLSSVGTIKLLVSIFGLHIPMFVSSLGVWKLIQYVLGSYAKIWKAIDTFCVCNHMYAFRKISNQYENISVSYWVTMIYSNPPCEIWLAVRVTIAVDFLIRQLRIVFYRNKVYFAHLKWSDVCIIGVWS